MEELKKCPFCGAEAIIHTDGWVYSVDCLNCRVRVYGCETEEEAIDEWNRRVEK